MHRLRDDAKIAATEPRGLDGSKQPLVHVRIQKLARDDIRRHGLPNEMLDDR
jgi:hypothetical protein